MKSLEVFFLLAFAVILSFLLTVLLVAKKYQQQMDQLDSAWSDKLTAVKAQSQKDVDNIEKSCDLRVQDMFIRRDLSSSGLLTIVCKRLLIRKLEDRFESQSRASRSGIALGVSPL